MCKICDDKKIGFAGKDFALDRVILTDEYSQNALHKEIEYLLALDCDKLIAGFYEMQGGEKKADKYLGWESTEIQGHTLGHYLVGIAQGYLNTKSQELLNRMNYIMKELKKCQLENGYLFASGEEIFDRVENRKPAWVPWYTMHKILAGLVVVFNTTGNKDSFEVALKLGDWVYNRTKTWSKDLQAQVLAVEYGGMNDALYELYKITNSEKHLYAAHMFDELPLFTAMKNKEDVLDGKHANTTIPKILGALNRYMTLDEGEEFYLEVAKNFWDIVVDHHTYVTGGNSEWEHFGHSDILDGERTNCNCETCNTYNMLKLTKGLFQVTGDIKYADFYERTQLNAILSSQNPETGMTTYFQPMATGYFKVYGTPFDKFWCCTGTGMENFTKLNDGIYFYKERELYINRYISSEVLWEEEGVSVIQNANIPSDENININIKFLKETSSKELTLCLRIPEWIDKKADVAVNGHSISYIQEAGFIKLNRKWSHGDQIILTLPMKVKYSRLTDNPNTVAFTYGPVVLSAAIGTEDLRIIQTGVAVDIPTKDFSIKDFIILKNGTITEWLENLDKNLIKRENCLEFDLNGTDEDGKMVFTPHYKQYEERYGIYWVVMEADSQEHQKHIRQDKDRKRLEESMIDKIPVGNDQYELVHNIKGENTFADGFEGHRCRVIKENGWISYQLKVWEETDNYLCTSYYNIDIGKGFNIYINDNLLLCDILQDDSGNRFFEKQYLIPKEMIKGLEYITVKFEHKDKNTVNSIWDLLYIRSGYDHNTDIKELRCNGKIIEPEEGTYLLSEINANEASIEIVPNNANALVYINDVLIDDTVTRRVVFGDKKEVEIKIVAEDRISIGIKEVKKI